MVRCKRLSHPGPDTVNICSIRRKQRRAPAHVVTTPLDNQSAAGGSRLTETGLSVGTPYYMSPEQATGDQEVGPPSDTYALACVLCELLVGEPPYPGSTAQAVLGKIIAGDPGSATKHPPTIPAHVDAAIRKALEKLPTDRFTGAEEFAKLRGRQLHHRAEQHSCNTASAVAGLFLSTRSITRCEE